MCHALYNLSGTSTFQSLEEFKIVTIIRLYYSACKLLEYQIWIQMSITYMVILIIRIHVSGFACAY